MKRIADLWASEDVAALEARGLKRSLDALESPQGPTLLRNGGESVVNFSANDYLGLANDAELAMAAASAAAEWGTGAGASRLIVGDFAPHRALEEKLAELEGTEAALLFNSGYAANVGALGALVGDGDAIFSDSLNHASLVDGCRLSKAKVVVYPHKNVVELGRRLTMTPARRKLVVTDAVFSMDGDRAPLRELRALCDLHGAALYVDEAHSTGVIGPRGAGLCAELGVEPDVRMGTLSKALGCFGAYVAGSSALRELLFNRSRSLVFSTSLPPALAQTALVAVEKVMNDERLRGKLWANIERFAAGLEKLGLPAHRDSAIFSVVLGAPEAALDAAKALHGEGLWVKPIRPPTVPEGTSRLRFSLSAAHTPAQIDRALAALSRLRVAPALAAAASAQASQSVR